MADQQAGEVGGGFLLLQLVEQGGGAQAEQVAQQAAGLVTFPLIIIAYGQSTGALLGSGAPILAFFIGLVAWVIAFALLSTGFRSLTRGRLLGVADER